MVYELQRFKDEQYCEKRLYAYFCVNPVSTVLDPHSTARYQIKDLDLIFSWVPLNLKSNKKCRIYKCSNRGSNKLNFQFFSPFIRLDIAIFRAKNCFQCPDMVLLVTPVKYFNVQVCLHMFSGQLVAKKWKEIEKKTKL